MKKIIILTIALYCLAVLYTLKDTVIPTMAPGDYSAKSYISTAKRDLLCLFLAYPEHIVSLEKNTDNDILIILKSGKKIRYDDKILKTYNQKLNNPDLQDMLEQIYPLTSINGLMDKDYDPGRIRVYPLLNEVYGNSKVKVSSNLSSAKSTYGNFQFNKNNNAAKHLEKAVNEIAASAKINSRINSYIYPVSGTFNYRTISGTSRLSPHAFCIAIDLASHKYDYWQWATKSQGEKRLASYPQQIVEAFEKNYFIWGGKWNHFDILHFEYRPEIIIKSRFFANKSSFDEPWYIGATIDDANVAKYIKLIDEVME